MFIIRLVLGSKPMVCGWPMFCVEETPNSSVIGIGKIEVLWVDLKNLCEDTSVLCVCGCCFITWSLWGWQKPIPRGDMSCTAVLQPGFALQDFSWPLSNQRLFSHRMPCQKSPGASQNPRTSLVLLISFQVLGNQQFTNPSHGVVLLFVFHLVLGAAQTRNEVAQLQPSCSRPCEWEQRDSWRSSVRTRPQIWLTQGLKLPPLFTLKNSSL